MRNRRSCIGGRGRLGWGVGGGGGHFEKALPKGTLALPFDDLHNMQPAGCPLRTIGITCLSTIAGHDHNFPLAVMWTGGAWCKGCHTQVQPLTGAH